MRGSLRILVSAASCLCIAHALDLLSTVLVLALVPGVVEGNPLMVDSVTAEFILWRGLLIKTLAFIFWEAPMAGALLWATKNYTIASVFMWIAAYKVLGVALKNFLHLLG